MDNHNTYEVQVHIGANASHYWGELAFIDRQGKPHLKNFKTADPGSVQANILKAMIASLHVLKRPCMLVIHTDADYLISAYQNNWIQRWKENGWKTAKGADIKNKELWQQLSGEMAKHSMRFAKGESKC